ncbi:hypothetical protein LCGC14_0456300 [marine sediment metagenome]|uniref:Uncharacterized protein n=1 Tax=marine sediment metagenome TaxID=412755 RepID=A0A0F9SGD4_9ZZZZ
MDVQAPSGLLGLIGTTGFNRDGYHFGFNRDGYHFYSIASSSVGRGVGGGGGG